ncbi:MAG: HypC/HybG/HupF family hydrogenase formation chaperone [Thermodesulfobacteriota bacterium]
MCLAIPSEIVEIKEKMATVSVSGVQRQVSLILLPEEVEIGDYVLVHAGFAIQKIDRQAAEEALKFIDELLKQEDLAHTL